ncbi:MAG: YdcH family protein [Mucispirillum sp.]|nr:YdcH family protein [Mucispirillum sp.]
MVHDNYELVEKLCRENNEFRKLFDEHVRLEQDLEALYSLKYFPPAVENNIKELKRKKLLGKDKMDRIISGYQQ